jgi:hypothetical protein
MYIEDNDYAYFPMDVSASEGFDRVWCYTGLDAKPIGANTIFGSNLVGWEWDARVANGSEPPGVKTLATSPVTGELVQGYGACYLQNQNANVNVVKYKAASGALVVTTGTMLAAEDAAGNLSQPSNQASATVQSTSSGALLGDQTVEAHAHFNAAGLAEAFQATATGSGTVSSLSVYLDSSSVATKLTAGLYADSGGHPGALLGQATLSAPAAGAWNSVPLASGVPVTSGTAYWIAVLSPSGGGTIRFRDKCCNGKGTAAEVSSQTTLSTLPATWTTGGTSKDGPMSAYGSGATTSP